MAFENGSLSFRMYYLPKRLPGNVVQAFARQAAPPLKDMLGDEINGWVGGRHLLDVPITEDNAYCGGYLRLTLMQAERRIPPSLLRAECKMEELAQLQAEKKAFLSRKARGEIRQRVTERLLPKMPPQLRGITFVYHEKRSLFYADALSERQSDAFKVGFQKTVGMAPIPVVPSTAAAERRQVDVREWAPTSFTPDVPDTEMGESIGADFLTWLWFLSEARGGIVRAGDLGQYGVIVEGPLWLVREGGGAYEIVVRHGTPTSSAEAKTGLLGGKKLRRARVTLVQDKATWRATLDAEELVVRGLKLPEIEGQDPIGYFQERMRLLDQFADVLLFLYDRFVDERHDPRAWQAAQKEIHQWVSGRHART